MREGGANIFKHENRFKNYQQSIQLSSPLTLSPPEAKIKQQKIIHEIKKKKELGIKLQKKREL